MLLKIVPARKYSLLKIVKDAFFKAKRLPGSSRRPLLLKVIISQTVSEFIKKGYFFLFSFSLKIFSVTHLVAETTV